MALTLRKLREDLTDHVRADHRAGIATGGIIAVRFVAQERFKIGLFVAFENPFLAPRIRIKRIIAHGTHCVQTGAGVAHENRVLG